MRLTVRWGRDTGGGLLGLAAGVGLAVLLLSLTAAPASAHERREAERYQLTVGFGDEPAYAGVRNSVQVLVADGHGEPVTDLGDRLRVEVSAGGQRLELPLEPNFEVGESGVPGDYRAFFIPTEPGRYSFHVHGSIRGQRVDQRFTSSEKTFPGVEDPAKVSLPSRHPTNAQLAQRLDRVTPRLAASVQGALAQSRAVEQRARREVRQARLLAVAGIGLGLAGLVLGALAAATVRRDHRRSHGRHERRPNLAEEGWA